MPNNNNTIILNVILIDINGTITDIVTTITETHNQKGAPSNLASLVITLLGACKADRLMCYTQMLAHLNFSQDHSEFFLPVTL